MNEFLKETSNSVKELYHDVLDPLEDKFAFEKRPSDGEITGGPLVLVVGNHSSGKSTFLNHLMGEDIQKTGMAPTDDCFTVIRHSQQREERDGSATVSNPDLPFGGLTKFGNEFISHFRMKLVPNPLLKDVTLIDSPGMIDAADHESTRGYDFAGVVRWFAERVDVILLFFDPDRPGTTAESLTILTQALRGLDHKLLVVMNKMDAFRSMRDFARCYGTLCWNLGKVIRKKDIPQIFTTFVPVPGAPDPVLPLDDFATAREELIDEIRHAPVRRVDNMITALSQHAERLRMHARITSNARHRLTKFRGKLRLGLFGLALLGLGAAALMYRDGKLLEALLALVGMIVVVLAGMTVIRHFTRRREERILEKLDAVFEDEYERELVVGNRPDDLLLGWEKLKPLTERTIRKLGLLAVSNLSGRDQRRLQQIVEDDVPRMRSHLHRVLEERTTAAKPLGAKA